MRRLAPIAFIPLALSLAMAASPAAALVPADITVAEREVSSIVSVSPDVYYDEVTSTYYLFTTGARIGVYSSADGESWAEVARALTPSGPYFDPSVVKVADGEYRMYYVYRSSGRPDEPCSGKQLRYATSSDLEVWTARPDVLLDDLGCGVPNVVRAGDEYRLYYVRGGADLAHGTYLATSPDGLSWTPTNTMITPADMVDPSVVQLEDGTWLMFTADFPPTQPPPPGFVQKLYVGTSQDGLAWDFAPDAPAYVASGNQGAFDPDAVVLPDGTVRAWWAQGMSAESARVTAGDVALPRVPMNPGKPKVKAAKSGATITWSYPDGAPPDGYIVQVRTSASWKDVDRVTTRSATIAWATIGAKKGKAFKVRVVAFIGDTMAVSPTTTSKRPR